MEMPRPTRAHQELQRIAGDWIGKERIYPSQWDPKGGDAVGRVHNTPALDGFAVIQDYEQEKEGKVIFRGHGVFTWNQQEECYVLYWFDSSGMPGSLFKGSFENSLLTLLHHNPQAHVRAVWDFRAKDRYTYRLEMSPDGNSWSPFLDGSYDRKK